MQIISSGDKVHDMSNPVFEKNKKNIPSLWSVEFAQREVIVKILSDVILRLSYIKINDC